MKNNSLERKGLEGGHGWAYIWVKTQRSQLYAQTLINPKVLQKMVGVFSRWYRVGRFSDPQFQWPRSLDPRTQWLFGHWVLGLSYPLLLWVNGRILSVIQWTQIQWTQIQWTHAIFVVYSNAISKWIVTCMLCQLYWIVYCYNIEWINQLANRRGKTRGCLCCQVVA